MHIPVRYADVYEIGHEHGDDQLEKCLHQHQHHAEYQVAPVLMQADKEPLEVAHVSPTSSPLRFR